MVLYGIPSNETQITKHRGHKWDILRGHTSKSGPR